MTSKIFKSILSVAGAVLLASLVIITGVMYQYFGSVQVSQLKDELNMAAKATNEKRQTNRNKYFMVIIFCKTRIVFLRLHVHTNL